MEEFVARTLLETCWFVSVEVERWTQEGVYNRSRRRCANHSVFWVDSAFWVHRRHEAQTERTLAQTFRCHQQHDSCLCCRIKLDYMLFLGVWRLEEATRGYSQAYVRCRWPWMGRYGERLVNVRYCMWACTCLMNLVLFVVRNLTWRKPIVASVFGAHG